MNPFFIFSLHRGRAGRARQRHWRAAAIGLALLGLQGCSSTLPYARPDVALPAAFKEAPAPNSTSLPVAVGDAWWQVFGDPVLNQLQESLLAHNQTLQASVAQYSAARAELGASRAALLPTVGAGLAVGRSVNGGGTPQAADVLSANAAWELDLWGRLSGAVDASQARLQASQDDLAAVRLSLQGTLTQTYLALRTADAQIDVVQRSLQSFQRALELTQNRYGAGLTSSADVSQAQSQLRSTQAQLIEARITRAQLEHAIAVLTGFAPSDLALGESTSLPTVPALPELLPATLLERRPDIAAAERRVAAAFAQEGVARSAFFPSLSLSANAGYRGESLANLVSAPNLFWSVGPALALSLFDGGARRAAQDQAAAGSAQAVASYRQTVLQALQEVEDNLVLSRRLAEERVELAAALDAARSALAVVNNQYRAGTVSYLNVLTAQNSVLSAERSLLDVQYRGLVASAQLLKNIAGKWAPVQQ
jgi:NodT family efflux transporter outer membrane factor (OMF) lipoprotein